MHTLALLTPTLYPLCAQFKSTVPLVIAPTTITDSKGRFIGGPTASRPMLYDDNVPQTIQVDTVIDPISLVVLVEANSSSEAELDQCVSAFVDRVR